MDRPSKPVRRAGSRLVSAYSLVSVGYKALAAQRRDEMSPCPYTLSTCLLCPVISIVVLPFAEVG